MRIVNLRVEGLKNPLGIDRNPPRLSWQLQTARRGTRQTAYQVQAASTIEPLLQERPDLWDSGWQSVDNPTGVPYGGVPLRSRQRVYWRVRVRDERGRISAWSEPAWFEMGLLQPTDWQARWIAPSVAREPAIGVCRNPVHRPPAALCPCFRYEFELPAPVRRARAYATGLGYYELYLNGCRVGDAVLEPSFTRFERRVEYATYDITSMLHTGRNAVGALVGQGWWQGPPCLLVQLEIELIDGRWLVIGTDTDWRWHPGPILENSLYGGEVYDARRERRGWASPGFRMKRGEWRRSRRVRMPHTLQLSARMHEPIRVVETLTPVQVLQPKAGVRVYDFGQNFSGWCRLRVQGKRGTRIILRHAELLYPDGTVNQENLRSAKATDVYILRGGHAEQYEPRFTYHGFRYVQVEIEPPDEQPPETDPVILALEGRVVHTDFARRGTFACSNPLLNQIQQNAVWGYRTNFHSIPTDCPQRDERQGWLGDAHMTAAAGLFNFEAEQAYRKFLRDIADEQGRDGSIPDTVPFVFGSRPGDPMWSLAYPLILWTLYEHTGDVELLREHYGGVRHYLRSLEREAPDGILTRCYYGDWVAVEEGTPKPLVATAAYALTARLVAQMAHVLGDQREEAYARRVFKRVARAFHQAFFNSLLGQYDEGTQASNVLALAIGLTPPEHQLVVLQGLVDSIRERYGGHLATGFIGTRFLLDTLVQHGQGELAYTVATQRTYPSWGFMIENGATTIWELWRLATGPGMNSHNHPAFGFISSWFYETLVGLRPLQGWRRFVVQPHILGDLTWAEARVQTPLGLVYCRWERQPSCLNLILTIPPCAQATLYLPTLEFQQPTIVERDMVLWKEGRLCRSRPTIRGGEHNAHWVRFEIDSGRYEFQVLGQALQGFSG